MNRNWLILFLIFISTVSLAQEKLSEELVLTKDYPIYVSMAPESLCKSYPVARLLADSLKKEGFNVIDSAGWKEIVNNFYDHLFRYHERHKDKTLEELTAYYKREQQRANLYQGVLISNNTCLDTQHNFNVTIYHSIRWKERASLNFTFPLESPYSVTTVILSLIKR